MTDETLAGASPAEDVQLSPSESSADSSPAPDKAPEEKPADDAGESAPRDEDGKFLSKNAQKRIDKLTWENDRARREAEYWRAEAMRKQQADPAAEPPKPIEAPAKPKIADFNYDEPAYEAAMVEYASAMARAAAENAIAQREREAAERAKAQTFRQKEAEFKSKAPDYEEVAYYAPISNEVAELVRESQIGPEIAYYLGKNPELAQSISQLPEKAAAREIGKIEAKLELQREAAAKAAVPPPVSKAPPPPPRIEAANAEPAVRTTDPSGDALSDDEWFKAELKRVAKLRKR